jgi:hypothetical protein
LHVAKIRARPLIIVRGGKLKTKTFYKNKPLPNEREGLTLF